MTITMKDINATVREALQKTELEYTIDNRIEVLALLADKVAEAKFLDSLERVRLSLEIAVEIVRLRVEKQMFGL